MCQTTHTSITITATCTITTLVNSQNTGTECKVCGSQKHMTSKFFITKSKSSGGGG
jgi:hypothetical protein